MPIERSVEPEARGLCAPHGLRYDPSVHRGCVLCRRGADELAAAPQQSQAAPPPARFRSALLLGLILTGLAALLSWQELSTRAPETHGEGQTLKQLAPESATRPREPALAHKPAPAPQQPPLRLLFIGNSLTFVHEMPALIARLVASAGHSRPFLYRRETPGGFGFLEHLQTGGFRQLLAPGRFDFVVLQDQGQRPSWTNAQQLETQFKAPARRLHAEALASGAKPIFYQTYARRDGDPGNHPGDTYEAMQQRIDEGYANIARELGAPVVHVGATWQTMHREHPELPLWQEDGLHPTLAGAYLTACAFYAYFYRQSPLGNRYLAELPEPIARQLQTVATQVWLRP